MCFTSTFKVLNYAAMKKQDAISIFGGKAVDLAKAVKKGKSAISQWPEQLTNDQINLVIGAAVRAGKQIPASLIK